MLVSTARRGGKISKKRFILRITPVLEVSVLTLVERLVTDDLFGALLVPYAWGRALVIKLLFTDPVSRFQADKLPG